MAPKQIDRNSHSRPKRNAGVLKHRRTLQQRFILTATQRVLALVSHSCHDRLPQIPSLQTFTPPHATVHPSHRRPRLPHAPRTHSIATCYRRLLKTHTHTHTPFTGAFLLQSSSRNCSPATDLVFFPYTSYSPEECFFTDNGICSRWLCRGSDPSGPLRSATCGARALGKGAARPGASSKRQPGLRQGATV